MSNRNARMLVSICLLLGWLGFSGCSSYITPGRGADLARLAPESQTLQEGRSKERRSETAQREPKAAFPAHVAVVRVQEPSYKSMTNEGIGKGRYSVVTVRDIERDEDFERLTKLPLLAKIAPLSRMQLPASFESSKELRQAALELHADMILIYTVDTVFSEADESTPLSAVALGAGSTADVRITTCISALLIDARTGYLYSTIEEAAHERETSSSLSSTEVCDRLRLKIERRAFERFLYRVEEQWLKVVEKHRE